MLFCVLMHLILLPLLDFIAITWFYCHHLILLPSSLPIVLRNIRNKNIVLNLEQRLAKKNLLRGNSVLGLGPGSSWDLVRRVMFRILFISGLIFCSWILRPGLKFRFRITYYVTFDLFIPPSVFNLNFISYFIQENGIITYFAQNWITIKEHIGSLVHGIKCVFSFICHWSLEEMLWCLFLGVILINCYLWYMIFIKESF